MAERAARTVVIALVTLLTAYGAVVAVALILRLIDLGNVAEIVTIAATGGAVLVVVSGWLASEPRIRGVVNRVRFVLLAEFGILGIVAIVVGTAKLVEIFT